MVYETWKDVAEALGRVTGEATDQQLALAERIGLDLPKDTPQLIAQARLRIHLATELGMQRPRPATESQCDWIEELSDENGFAVPDNSEEAHAWIEHMLLCRRRSALEVLQVEAGDIVARPDGSVAEVSSIGENGRVHFKGGMGAGAWPDTLSIVGRRSDDDPAYREGARSARNAASLRRPATEWSLARSADLAEFSVDTPLTVAHIDQFELIVEQASDERPIQAYLQQNPQLLTVSLLGGRDRHCLPQKRLGSEYVPDFMLAEVDSLGIHWLVVELETPNSKVLTKRGDLEQHAREGVKQVRDWREWLTPNVYYARGRRSEGGLGLYDIADTVPALVLVGRRSRIIESSRAVRAQHRSWDRIDIHTYDWLIERARHAINYTGMPIGLSLPYELTSPHTDLFPGTE